MPLTVSMKPTSSTFVLRADPTGETRVSIRQATTGDMIRLADLFADQTQIFDNADIAQVKIKKRWNSAELMRYRAFLTLTDSNIAKDDEGTPLFTFNTTGGITRPTSEKDFFAAWGALPPDVAEEIYEYVLEVNPFWNPFAEGE